MHRKLDSELVFPMRLCLVKSTVGSELATATFDLREGVNEEMRGLKCHTIPLSCERAVVLFLFD